MRQKPIHYHVYPNLGDWEYEYSGNAGLGNAVSSQCDCQDKIAACQNDINFIKSQIQSLSTTGPALTNHINNRIIHVTQADRDRWDAGGSVDLSSLAHVAFTGSYNDLTLKPTIPDVTGFVNSNALAPVAFSGLYSDLVGTPTIPEVIATLSSTSTSPVLSRIIKQALDAKADASAISLFITSADIALQLSAKQDKLTAGDGINIANNVISCTLDTDVYVIVNDLNGVSNPDPDKIYILETKVGDEYSYEQYRYKNSQWVYIGDVEPTVDLSGYLTEEEGDYRYQPKGEYLTALDLTPYALARDLSLLNDNLANYALVGYVDRKVTDERTYADATFLKKTDYTAPTTPEEQQSTPTIIQYTVDVDAELDATSPNPVENRAVYAALDTKATKTQLTEYAKLTDLSGKADESLLINYITTNDLITQLALKQNRLVAGEGISIVNDVISADLDIDTDVYVIVDELPTVNIESNKLYLVPEEDLENPGNIIYSQYKYDDTEHEWIPLGQVLPTIDLQEYITRLEAAESFAPRYDYATSQQFNTLRQYIEDEFQRKGDYITLTYADDTYQRKGNYITSVNLSGYAKLSDLPSLTDYATKKYVDDAVAGITPTTTPGNTTTTIINTVDVDPNLDATSPNPVENRAVYAALAQKITADDLLSYALNSDLANKADKSQLNSYVRNDALTTALGTKQDILTEGSGISINENNEISVTLDTEPFVIVDELPTTNINPNKIYLLLHEDNGNVYYTEHRRDTQNNTWIDLGTREVNIDLSDYIKERDADIKYLITPGTYLTPEAAEALYQHIGDYILRSEVQSNYQRKGNFVETPTLEALYATIQNTYLKKNDLGNYLSYNDAVNLFQYILSIIDNRYVLKSDVRSKMHIEVDSWSRTTPVQMPISGNALPGQGGNSGGSSSISNMVTLTTDQYQALVDSNLVDENTYYFTYEETTWGFGDQFPIILTEGTASDSIGEFPINLT